MKISWLEEVPFYSATLALCKNEDAAHVLIDKYENEKVEETE